MINFTSLINKNYRKFFIGAIVIFIIMFIYTRILNLVVMIIALIFHELGHIIVSKVLRKKIFFSKFSIIGINLELFYNEHIDKMQSMLISLGGPIFNLILYFLGSLAFNFFGKLEFVELFTLANFCLAVGNLFPIAPLDGSKVLIEILKPKYGLTKTHNYVRKLSIFMSIIIGVVFIILLNINVFFICVYLFIFNMKNIKELYLLRIQDYFYKIKIIAKRGCYKIKEIIILESSSFKQALENLEFENYYIINIVDNNFNILKKITETDLIDALLENRCVDKVGHIIKNR